MSMHLYLFFPSPEANPQNNGLFALLDHWQTLIGACLGAVIGIAGSIYVFRFQEKEKEKNENQKQWKEALRRVEIRLTMSLEDTVTARRQLRETTASIKRLITDVKATPSTAFAIQVVNFPVTGRLYREEKLAELKTRSSYLHNKLIIVDKVLKETDARLEAFKKDFDGLQRRNEFITTLACRIAVATGKQELAYADQRDVYARDLEEFTKALEIYSEGEILKLIVLLEQSKLYSRHLDKDYEATINQYEPKEESSDGKDEKTLHPLSFVDRIDSELQAEVKADIKLAEERLAETQDAQNALYHP